MTHPDIVAFVESPAKLGRVGEGCSVRVPKLGDIARNPVRGAVVVTQTGVEGTWQPVVLAGSPWNELVSLINRTLLPVPQPRESSAMLTVCHRVSQDLVRKIGRVCPWTALQVVQSYSGSKRRLYESVLKDLQVDPLQRADARVTAFVKHEKWHPDSALGVGCVPKPPRMIQHRNPRYNIVLGKYTKPAEKKLYRIRSDWLGGASATGAIAKGRNMQGRAALIRAKSWPGCGYIEMDATKFDAHVCRPLLRLEHSTYLGLCPSRELSKVLNWQLQNKGRTKWGLKYECDARRMSGDMNTALGNCVLMVIMATAVMRILRVERWDILDDGDDCLLVVPRWVLDSRVTDRIKALFLDVGMEMKVKATFNMSDVEFCQARVVGDRMVVNPAKSISHAFTSVRPLGSERLQNRWVLAVAEGQHAVHRGVPVLGPFWAALRANLKRRGYVSKWAKEDGELHDRALRESGVDFRTISEVRPSDESRIDYALAWDLAPTEQLAIEEGLVRFAEKYEPGRPQELASSLYM